MDFHALPRRDLQALCKRNGVRANMANAAMADALRALPTVDGVEEYVKQPVAAPTPAVKSVAEDQQREEQGSPLPRGRRVTVRPDEGEKEEEDLKLDANEEKAPDVGVGRSGPSRRARAAVVAAPPTTRRRAAAASKIEAENVAAEAVPAPTTRRRIQGATPVEAEKKEPRARRTSTRAAARKAGMQQEEEEGNPQDAISEVETVLALPVSDEGFDDPEEVEEATNPQTEEGPVQEDEAAVSDVEITVPAPVSDEICDDAEAVEEATVPQNEELGNSVDESSKEDEGVVMDTPAPVEEETRVVEECKDESAVQEPQANVQQCATPLPFQEDSPIMGLVEQEGGAAFPDGAASDEEPSGEEMSDGIRHAAGEEMEMVPVDEAPHATMTAREEVSFTGDDAHASEEPGKEEEGVTHAAVSDLDITVPALVSDEVCDDAEDVDEATEPQNEELSNAVEESSREGEGVAMGTPTPVAEECKDKSAAQERPINVQQCAPPLPCQEDSPILDLVEQEGSATFRDGGEGPLDEEAGNGSEVEEMELVPVNDVPQATLTATEEVSYAGHEEIEVAGSTDLLQHGTEEANSSLFEEKEDETVDGTVLLDFSGKTTRIEDEGVVSTVEMPQNTVTMGEDAGDEDRLHTEICRAGEQKELVTAHNVSKVSVIENEAVGNKSVFSSYLPPEFDGAGDLGDGITSLFFDDMVENVTKSMTSVIAGEPTGSEAEDVALCMRISNITEEKSNELVPVEEENEAKYEKQNEEPLVSNKLKLLSLRKLRAKLKETLIAHKRKDAKRVALARLDENAC